MLLTRKHGEEHPYWPAGPFKIRLPFIRVRSVMVSVVRIPAVLHNPWT